ncbi:hypothetical protein BCON_0215g00100 [Botryotinia convoluta]|uniref:Prion-inhibition and propagation HeLo domain-containing protein n=1 Tax=Botryotinia convoluta TaxID=54673 RepID=A0A4Z1HPP7_9HELO|nr:hypothetical protein BCON_0215g00100 [Botryotinia convoluta]
MHPFSITVGAVGLIIVFKEVYLLSRCIYRACESARASDEEREKLRHDLRYDLLRIRSFGRHFLRNKNMFGDHGLGNHWASMIYDMFEELRKSLDDYRKLTTHTTCNILHDKADPIPPAKLPAKKLPFNSLFNRTRETTKLAVKSAKWALYDRKRLESTISTFRRETEKLTGLLPLAQSAQVSRIDNKIDALAATINDRDAQILGLQCIVKTTSDDNELSAGAIELKHEGSNTAEQESVLIELKYYPPSEENCNATPNYPNADTKTNVRRLAGLLSISSSGSELRTLPFKFYVHEPNHERYAFVFGYPLHALQSQQISLHELIKSSTQDQRFSIAIRFQVAEIIAKSIGVFHADGWVHKNVCSRSPYLVDFGYSRPEEGKTYARYQQTTNSDALYLHADRPRMTFTKLHDIYALGVVLLEIATWKTAKDLDLDVTTIDKEEVRERFLSIAKKSIPYHMGTTYMEAVISCLDDTYRGHTASSTFMETFQTEIIEELSAKQLLSR